MTGKGITYAAKFSGMLSSLTTFICSACIFVRTRGEIDLNTLLYALYIIVPAALIVGFLGYRIGNIFDNKKKKKKLNKYIK